MRKALVIATAAGTIAAASLAAGCGGADGSKPELKVSAAASLDQAFTRYAKRFASADVRLSFAGSDELAAQIERGARPDVFASANTELPNRLFVKGLVTNPVEFATNELVIAVPANDSKIGLIRDLAKPGVKIAAGSSAVPVGSYTRELIGRLPAAEASAIEGNIRSNEPDVAGVTAKVVEGAVDAGFVYATDVEATKGKLRAIAIPANLKPKVIYAAAIVKGTQHEAQAGRFLEGLVSGAGRRDLAAAGFGSPG